MVHCTAGKDRTGVICALVLSLCGVEDEIISQEYALTEIGLPNEWKETVIKHLINDPNLKGDTAGAISMVGSK